MDTSIYEFYKNGIISKENAVLHSIDPDLMLNFSTSNKTANKTLSGFY